MSFIYYYLVKFNYSELSFVLVSMFVGTNQNPAFSKSELIIIFFKPLAILWKMFIKNIWISTIFSTKKKKKFQLIFLLTK